MKTKVVYKSRQEKILMEELAESSMINMEQLHDIKKYYSEDVAYHNFLHALTVATKVLELSCDKYNIIEVRSLFIAALFHDAGHKWTAEDLDEFRSLDIAFENIEKFEKKYNFEWIDVSIVRNAIMWTVFKKRGTNANKYARIMADLDIHTLGLDFVEFLYYADFGMAVEIGEHTNWKLDLEKWFSNISFFKFLLWVNKKIFLIQGFQDEFLHNSLYNIERYIQISKNDFKNIKGEKIIEIFNTWKNNDITLEEFKKEYFD